MKDSGVFSVLGSNNFAVAPQKDFTRWVGRQRLMCWKCQKDKLRYGGEEKMMGGGVTTGMRRFICNDCVEAKLKTKDVISGENL